MNAEIFESRKDAIRGVEKFYADREGYSYSDDQVDRWLKSWFFPYVKLEPGTKILDICCGDGCWALGLMRHQTGIKVRGYDISQTAIDFANNKAKVHGDRLGFFQHDCVLELPEADESFDLIFARGLFLFNQHDMMRPKALELLRNWHEKLIINGSFVAMYGSIYDRMGTYTPFEETVGFPLNGYEEKEAHRVFTSGKYNHTIASFSAPFFALDNAVIQLCHFENGRHTVITRKTQRDN